MLYRMFLFTDSQKVLSSKKRHNIWMQLAFRPYLSWGLSPNYRLQLFFALFHLHLMPLKGSVYSPSTAWIPSYKALQNHPRQSNNVLLLCADHMATSNDLSISHFCVISLMWGHFGSSQIAEFRVILTCWNTASFHRSEHGCLVGFGAAVLAWEIRGGGGRRSICLPSKEGTYCNIGWHLIAALEKQRCQGDGHVLICKGDISDWTE